MMTYIALTMIIEEDKSADYIYAAPPFRMIDFCLGILLYRFYRSEKGKQVYALITTQFTTWQAHIADVAIVLLSTGMYYLSIYTNPNFRCAALYWLPAVVSIFYFVASDQGKGGSPVYSIIRHYYGWVASVLRYSYVTAFAFVSCKASS